MGSGGGNGLAGGGGGGGTYQDLPLKISTGAYLDVLRLPNVLKPDNSAFSFLRP